MNDYDDSRCLINHADDFPEFVEFFLAGAPVPFSCYDDLKNNVVDITNKCVVKRICFEL
jgi:hypothetical protein